MDKLELLMLKACLRSRNMYKYMEEYGVLGKFNSIYPFTTENIDGYLKKFDVKGQTVLTVGGSGDQVLNLYAYGAKEVDYFDINPFTEMYFNLKCAALKALNNAEFLEYFCYDDFPKTFKKNSKAFNESAFAKITPFLSDTDYKFWHRLYKIQSGLETRKSLLFSDDEEKAKVLLRVNKYLSLYDDMEKIISDKKSPNFFETNITKLPNILSKKYDLILLSNIAQYLDYIYSDNELERFRDLILELTSFLNPNGEIMLAYLYDTVISSPWSKDNAQIYNLERVFDVFKREKLTFSNFDSILDLKWDEPCQRKDAVLVYTKK